MKRTPATPLTTAMTLNRSRMPALLTSVCALLIVAGCTNLAPTFERPALPVPGALSNAATTASAGSGATSTPLGWDAVVQSAALRDVIALALDSNRDLRAAALAIERAQAQYGVSRADRLPSVSASGQGSRSRTAADLTAAGRSQTNSQYTAQLGISSYEIDFFGRVQNLNAAAWEEVLRVTDNQRTVQLSLVAEVSSAWLTLAANQARLALAQETLRSREASYRLTQRMHQLGGTSGLVLAQNQTTVESARADVAAFTSQVERDRNLLQLLVGAPVPAELWPTVPAVQPVPEATAANAMQGARSTTAATAVALTGQPALQLLAVPANLNSEQLLARPDVQAAERSLRAANANIGAARAAFFPSITLTGAVGTSSNALSGLFEGGNGIWSFAPQIRLPIFDGGRNQANLDVAQANQKLAVNTYEKAIQTAFREVADALAERATLQERLNAQTALLAATERAFALSQARFKAGVDNYLTVLDAQRSLYAAQQSLLSLQLAEQVNRATLYKVMGGG